MRVLFVGDCPYIPTSLGKITYYITRGLLEAGFETYNMCPMATVTIWDQAITHVDQATGLAMTAFPWNGPITPVVRMLDPDVVLLFGSPYAPPLHEALRECPELGKPCAGYFDNESLHVIPEYALHAANAVAFASPTEFARKTLAEGMVLGGVPEDIAEQRTLTVYHGVDIDYYTDAAKQATPLFSDNLFTYGTFSKNHVRKNIAVLLEAYAMLGEKRIKKTRLFLPLVGFGGDNTWNVELVIRYVEGLHRVTIHDRVVGLDPHERRVGVTEHQVARMYRSMHTFIFPSEGEAFGLPPVEAALFGLPVIVTSHPALLEIWSELPRECIVPAKPYILPEAFGLVKPDPQALSTAMKNILENDKLRRRAAAKAHEIARRYDWKQMVKGIIKLIELATEPDAKPINAYLKQKPR